MTVLVTGGAGYIGSHMVLALAAAGEKAVVIDNLITGFRESVAEGTPLYVGDIADGELVGKIIREHSVDAVIHFAGSVVVPESVADPLKYYQNNTCRSRTLIETCVRTGIQHFIFSSTAAVYGMPETEMVTESTPLAPISPYGTSKLMTEWMLRDVAHAHSSFRYVALRYFNVAGADPEGRIGQSTKNATHLIKVACQAALGLRAHLEIFGEDYPTPDGTGVRDYIHVTDLAQAHLEALRYLRQGGNALVANCGYGRGFSVRQVIEAVEQCSNRKIIAKSCPRRPGDPAALVADSTIARDTLRWKPHLDDLSTIVSHAYAWERHLSERNR